MPHLQKIYEEYRAKGFELIAVNAGDSEKTILDYFQKEKFTFRSVIGGEGANYTVGKAYGVQAYPTNYLVGGDGKILFRSVGFDEDGLRAAIKKALE